MQRIMKVVEQSVLITLSEHFIEEYRAGNIIERFKVIMEDINEFFDNKKQHKPNINNLTARHIATSRIKRILGKLQQKYFNF